MKNLLLLPLCAALLASTSLLTGCGNGTPATQAPAANTPAAQATATEALVMKRHEHLMEQADMVIALAARLQASPRPPRPLLAKLQAADQAMMTWMHQYQAPDSTAPAPVRLAYMQGQLHKLDSLEVLLRTPLDSAKALVQRQSALPAPAPAAPAH